MSLWIELRCEDRHEKYAEDHCWSNHVDSETSQLCASSVEAVVAAKKEIEKNTLNAGGHKVKKFNYLLCPHCVEQRKKLGIPLDKALPSWGEQEE